MAELTVQYESPTTTHIESVTITVSEVEARAMFRVLTSDEGRLYAVRQSNRAVYDVIEELEQLFDDEEL